MLFGNVKHNNLSLTKDILKFITEVANYLISIISSLFFFPSLFNPCTMPLTTTLKPQQAHWIFKYVQLLDSDTPMKNSTTILNVLVFKCYLSDPKKSNIYINMHDNDDDNCVRHSIIKTRKHKYYTHMTERNNTLDLFEKLVTNFSISCMQLWRKP